MKWMNEWMLIKIKSKTKQNETKQSGTGNNKHSAHTMTNWNHRGAQAVSCTCMSQPQAKRDNFSLKIVVNSSNAVLQCRCVHKAKPEVKTTGEWERINSKKRLNVISNSNTNTRQSQLTMKMELKTSGTWWKSLSSTVIRAKIKGKQTICYYFSRQFRGSSTENRSIFMLLPVYLSSKINKTVHNFVF